MSWEGWSIFATFWAVFVTTPGPNAVNCITNGVTLGFRRSVPGIAGILTQAALFLALSALGVSALLLASPVAFQVAKLIGAAFLIYLGVRTWRQAGRALSVAEVAGGTVYGRAFLIATINPKSVAGYLAAFTQFVQPDVPIGAQMWVIVPTALSLTALSYSGYTALGAMLGRSALGAVASRPLRRGLAVCFVVYGALLGAAALP
ncbi:MAG: LysE family transporter [Roseovarius sp.]